MREGRREKVVLALERARVRAGRGERAREFLAGKFWREDVLPAIRKARMGFDSGWRPGTTPATLEAVALRAAHVGGSVDVLMDLSNTHERWVTDGAAAAKRIPRLERALEETR